MTAVLQRVDRAACTVEGEVTGETGKGLLVLLGVAAGDTEADAAALAAKIARCRIFCDESGKMQRSVLDISGGALVISNFTLLADYAHGNRPSYFGAAAPGTAEELYRLFVAAMEREGVPTATGRFGADMRLSIEANGPVTIVMESAKLKKQRRTANETAH